MSASMGFIIICRTSIRQKQLGFQCDKHIRGKKNLLSLEQGHSFEALSEMINGDNI